MEVKLAHISYRSLVKLKRLHLDLTVKQNSTSIIHFEIVQYSSTFIGDGMQIWMGKCCFFMLYTCIWTLSNYKYESIS